QAVSDQRIDLPATRIGAHHDIVEKLPLGLVIGLVLDCRPKAMIVKFLEEAGEGSALHLLLVKRLNGREARGGTRTGAGLGHCAAALAAACPARKGRSAAAT